MKIMGRTIGKRANMRRWAQAVILPACDYADMPRSIVLVHLSPLERDPSDLFRIQGILHNIFTMRHNHGLPLAGRGIYR